MTCLNTEANRILARLASCETVSQVNAVANEERPTYRLIEREKSVRALHIRNAKQYEIWRIKND